MEEAALAFDVLTCAGLDGHIKDTMTAEMLDGLDVQGHQREAVTSKLKPSVSGTVDLELMLVQMLPQPGSPGTELRSFKPSSS